ncbi:MAG: OmpP1/FadL family transporter [Salinibacter sp.]|uniref:OmpP1/FadL family transporter n=1 Tax=Salinibacter sp. TaxID=2065818 RepID=UPI0035D4B6E5
MTRSLLPSTVLCLLLGGLLSPPLAPVVHGQTANDALRFSLRTPAPSARALGLSGGSTAGWADLSAMISNPAGLGYYTTSEITGNLNLLLTNDASTFQAAADAPTFRQEERASFTSLGSLAGVYKLPTEQGSLVFGFGYTRTQPFGRTLSYGGRNGSSSITDTFLPTNERPNDEYAVDSLGVFFPDDVAGNIIPFIAYQGGAIEFFRSDYDAGEYPFEQAALFLPIRQEGTVEREGRMNEINVSGAVEAAKNLMLGVSANLVTGQYQFKHELTEIDQGQNENYEVLRNGQLYSGLDRMTFRERFTSKFTGFNLRLGLSATAVSNVRVGFTAETPTWISVAEDFTDAVIRTEFLDGQSLAYGDDPDEDVGKGTFDYRITTPWRLSAGVAFDNDHLRIDAGVEFIDWSNLSLDSNTFGFPAENERIEDSFGYVFNFRGGIEYSIENGPTMRAGAAYRPDPREYDLTFANGETPDRTRIFFSAGLSYPLSDQMTVDVGWMQERSHNQFLPYTFGEPEGTPLSNPDEIPIPFVDEEVVRNQFQVGLRYRF